MNRWLKTSQETLIRIFKNIDKYKAQGSFEGWMRTIAINRSLQWIEKSCFRHELQPVIMPDTRPLPAAIYQKMNAEDILNLIKDLPDGFRAVFSLNVIEGYTHKEIGELLDISEATSRSQLSRARKLLQQKLENGNNIDFTSIRSSKFSKQSIINRSKK